MFNFGILINKFYDIFNKQQTFFEIILNLTFILILFILAFIFYWDSINRSVINNSRCKALIKNDDSNYTAYFYNDKTNKNTKLFSISYDNTKNHNVKISCEGVCSKSSADNGVILNTIDIPYYDYKEQRIDTSYTKKCYCDSDYFSTNINYSKLDDLGIDGDNFLADYYTEFYKSTPISTYDGKLYFPV